MAIFLKAYQGYSGELTSSIERIAVIFRYALADAFESRLFVAYFLMCFLLPVGLMCFLYVYHNIELLLTFEVPLGDLPRIDGNFFATAMQMPQNVLLFFMVVAIGPIMISPDLRNNAMPLYLSRPITKSSYILGKLLVLVFLGSLVSWVPGVLLFCLQAWLSGDRWFLDNLQIPIASFLVSMSWIISLTLVAFAVSAFVRWKAVARVAFFGVFLITSIVAAIIEEVFGGVGAYLVDLSASSQVLMAVLYDARNNSVLDFVSGMSASTAALQIFIISAVAYLILYTRIRAYQAVS